MQNKLLILILALIINCLLIINVFAKEDFIFNITEIEILDNGNKIIGKKRGDITTNDGVIISADNFTYNKSLNILNADGNVIIKDTTKNYKIFSKKIIYEKNDEIIFTDGLTDAEFFLRYYLKSKDIFFNRNEMTLSSDQKTNITDKKNNIFYDFKKFNFDINKEILKSEKILINLDYNLPESDKFFFENGILNLKNQKFIGKDVEILLRKDLFDDSNNDPRLKGVSVKSQNNITTIEKGVFTSCKKGDSCPSWAINAKKITHDKNKKILIYDDAWLKVYDIPVFYFPKFFHPDPTVERQSGLLKPQLNNSSVLGSSFNLPYYHVISESKDFTLRPTIFDKDIKMLQNEYRQVNENSSLILDFAFTDGYKSSLSNKKNSIYHLFANFDANLALENFTNSKFFLSIQKASNDTYLKIFDSNLYKSKITPTNYDLLNSEAKLILNSDNFNFTSGIQSFEDLRLNNSDRYQFILPYYNFDKQIFNELDNGIINFSSSGSNDLNNTNNLKTRIINDINFQSLDLISNNGFKNNFNFYLKNLNTVAKNDSQYKSSPQIELMSILEYNSSLPMINRTNKSINYLTPKISLRINPGDMKDYSSSDRKVNVDNIFQINRLGLSDSFEEGKSLTLGLDYKKTNISNINKFFEAKIATVLREKDENFIPVSTGIDKKKTNIFGSMSSNLSEFVNIGYDFIVDNDFNTLKYNSANATFSFKNLVTKFDYIEESGAFGNANTLGNKTTLKFNDENFLSFKTRRNRKINLTEYYDLIYEYKNDCLVAGLKYNKTYYEDRDLKPSENLLFTVTLTPLTSFEQKVDN